MYLRLTRARFDPAISDQVASVAQEIDAAMRHLPGIRHVHEGISRTTGTVAVVSLWGSHEQAGFAREALGEPIGRLRALGVQFEDPEIYEIMEGENAGG